MQLVEFRHFKQLIILQANLIDIYVKKNGYILPELSSCYDLINWMIEDNKNIYNIFLIFYLKKII
jgi:hypothetical protein